MMDYSKFDSLVQKQQYEEVIDQLEVDYKQGNLDNRGLLYLGALLIHPRIYDFETAVNVFKSVQSNYEGAVWGGFIYYFYHPEDTFFVSDLENRKDLAVSNYILGLYNLRVDKQTIGCNHFKKALQLERFPKLLIAIGDNCVQEFASKKRAEWLSEARDLIKDNNAKYKNLNNLAEYYKLRWDEEILGTRLPYEDYKAMYQKT